MYLDDLRTLFNIVNYNLAPNIKLGFHSHNNLQMSNALSQEFINLAQNRRDTVIDATLFGMGRGAGNTPTELVAQYLNSHMGGEYDIDKILDVIDSYISSLRAYNEWGYDIPMFLSGCYSAHVNNVGYLKEKGSLRFQDLRFILSKLTRDERKRYDYSRLESLYLEYAHKKSSRKDDLQQLKLELSERDIIVIAPGKSITIEQASIKNYIQNNSPLVISANFIPQGIKPDYIYFSNQQRYDYWKLDPEYHNYRKILLSNISDESMDFVIHIKHLLKAGWSNLDNTVILLLRLLDIVNVKSIALAGVDGYEPNAENYATQDLERKIMDYKRTNDEIAQMLFDFQSSSKIPISFVTHSRFGDVIK
jgi:4-hydroxy 2-oxovalerate aldolase